ncbi:MAG: hypothetical protein RI538_07305 [Salibaculum sp.]|uniref:hypothetical protein n=1 Tax=Salibaculum sp. TaxID=2855480 RepID=UPI00286FEC19|nr:hypothetical protein [Salibaculum sp.]MDR9427747.1 hypothetical protein [Salibaculum sp.]MDR9482577.1 hypothetical protein [Salibaculum sp.]
MTEVAPIQRFDRTVGITYSGAETAESSLKALRVYQTVKGGPAEEVAPPDGVKKYWSRHALADWLRERLAEDIPTIIGLDHALSFPMRYYEVHRLPPDWSAFLTDFRAHWPTDRPHTYVDFVRDGITGRGAERMGDPSWLRLTDEAVRAAKSVFQFSGHGSVAKATHAGLPWLDHIRGACPTVHIWPFDGWTIPTGTSAIVEVRPAMWKGLYDQAARTSAQHRAFTSASWLRDADMDGRMSEALSPELPPSVAACAQLEGWILQETGRNARSVRSTGIPPSGG